MGDEAGVGADPSCSEDGTVGAEANNSGRAGSSTENAR